jgi:hypothetical protein
LVLFLKLPGFGRVATPGILKPRDILLQLSTVGMVDRCRYSGAAKKIVLFDRP